MKLVVAYVYDGNFLKSAQTRWKELYSVDEAARMNTLAKAAKRQDGQRLSTPFVLVRPPTEASDTQPKERSSAS